VLYSRFLLLCALAGVPGLAEPGTDRALKILRSSCVACHAGPQAKGSLRLDSLENIAVGGASGAPVVPGDANKSLLVQRVSATDKAQRMPPVGAALPPESVQALKDWINAGAPGLVAKDSKSDANKHWSYKPPIRPSVPDVKNKVLVSNPIDAFLLSKLESQGLSFSALASRDTLVRRLSLDLIGLPPSPAEIAEFVNDQRPDAYNRLVERLLASKHYGERWARHWLDLSRYADTHGYEKDASRTMWKFRDWVIDAFNRDMPFDQFTIEQIAGDMLPNPTESQKVATGFHRNTMYNEEGGVDRDESHFEVLVDRVNTTGAVWLGSTLACAQCHNHKYDPFTHKDYYQMMAFFSNTVKEEQRYGTTLFKWREPQLDLATPDQNKQRNELRARIKQIEDKLRTSTPELEREQAAWEKDLIEAANDWKTVLNGNIKAESGSTLSQQPDGTIVASGQNPQRETYVIETPAPLKKLTGLRIEAIPDQALPRGGPGRDSYGHFALTEVHLEIGSGDDWKPIEFKRIVADDGRVQAKGTRQLWTIDASREEKRLPRQIVLVANEPQDVPKNASIRIRLVQNSDFTGQNLGRLRASVTAVKDPVVIAKLKPGLRPILAMRKEQRSPEASKELAAFFRTIAPSLEASRDELRESKNALDRLGIVTAMIMQEAPGYERPFDYVRVRGGYSSKGEKVYANVPAVLGALPASEMPNRLGLARWLASRENPLTARVAVNRIWEHYFGRGIVETSEDFGIQGERPVNQPLLDWLAVEFMDRGWSLKNMHRLIVTSTGYRQTSKLTPQLLQVDPYNRLISRGPRFRLEAEMIRDAGLAASGLLSAKIGGPSVFPPQPAGVWDIPYSDEKWEESKGEDKYRRAIYTFIRRSALYPAMMNFDATSREFCTVRRVRTNTPLAALTTLNDPAFFEMAQSLGRRIATEGGDTDSSRVDYGLRLVAARKPQPGEKDRLLTWLHKEREYFASHPDEAARLNAKPELAPWTMFANVLLNLDEALTKE
jgi:hypothetical protein